MKKEDFAEVLGDINEIHIQESETTKTYKTSKKSVLLKWSATAACFCLLIAALALTPGLFTSYKPTPHDNSDLPIQDNPIKDSPDRFENSQLPEVSRVPWIIRFNKVSSMISANRTFHKGVFTEALNDTDLSIIQPDADLECEGFARFDNYGNLLEIVMQVTTTIPESPVTVALADYYFGFNYILNEAELTSVCNDVEYRVYQYENGNTVTLSAYAIINDIYFAFSIDAPQSKLEQAKTDFQYVLECFAYYEEDKPDLSAITPKEIPELTEQFFNTLAQARTEPDFGRYLPQDLPAHFDEATIYRLKFQDTNFLSALWSKGLDDLSWVVRPYTEAEACRLTDVNDKKNYDLSLYPIPRADSVPDELREIVDDPIFEADELTKEAVYCRAYKADDAGDTNGWRMRFSVKYGNVIVSVNTKGVEPEWLYQQLAAINKN